MELSREKLAHMEDAARGAGEIIRKAHETELLVENKEGHANFVTQYDRSVQEYLTERLSRVLPDARFLGEENGMDLFTPEDEKGWLFVIDPIDGTTNFMHKLHPHVTSIGLFLDGKPFAGVIFVPETGQMFSAMRGQGAFENGRRIHSSPRPLSEQVIFAGSSGYSMEAAKLAQQLAFEFQKKCHGVRTSGSAAYNLCMVASGRAGLYFESRLGLWDFAAGAIILEEAGGKITDWYGEPLSFRGSSAVLARSGGILDGELPDLASCMDTLKGLLENPGGELSDEEVAGILDSLRQRRETVTTVESLTAGMISARMADIPGSSDVLKMALVTYSDAAKESLAGVSAKTLKAHSAVSAETAREMAEGGAKKAGASAALSATGYAGPPAGPEDDTVGRVFLGCFYRGSTEVEEHQYTGSRNQVRGKARDDALRMLRRRLSDE